MANITQTAANVIPGPNAKYRQAVAAVLIVAGTPVVKLSSDGKLYLSDNDDVAKDSCDGIAINGASPGQLCDYVYDDDQFNPGATVASGTIYVVSATAGAIAPAADLASGKRTLILGPGISTSLIRLSIIRGGIAP